MLNKLIRIANSLDTKGLRKEAERLDVIINKAAGLTDDVLTDDSAGSRRADEIDTANDAAWGHSGYLDDMLMGLDTDPEDDRYFNSPGFKMDLMEDTNIMPNEIVGDEDFLTIHEEPMALNELPISLPESLSEGIMMMAKGLLATADKNNDSSLSLDEIGMAIYEFISRRVSDENPDTSDEDLSAMTHSELSELVGSEDPFNAMLQRMNRSFSDTGEE